MPNYQLGKIYSIRSYQTDEIYIGSTVNTLSRRMTGHRCDYKTGRNRTSSEIIKYGDSYIELIELYPCNSKEELEREEGKYIRSMECINKCIPGRTRKEYDKDNKDKISIQTKHHYQKNKEKIQQYQKQHYQDNADKIKEYRIDNKDKKKEYDKKKYHQKFYNKLEEFILH